MARFGHLERNEPHPMLAQSPHRAEGTIRNLRGVLFARLVWCYTFRRYNMKEKCQDLYYCDKCKHKLINWNGEKKYKCELGYKIPWNQP